MLAGTMTMTTILLVDDSILLRAANAAILTRAGYTVLTAGDGEEALQVVRTRQTKHMIDDCNYWCWAAQAEGVSPATHWIERSARPGRTAPR